MGPVAGRAALQLRLERISFKKRPIFEQNERMTEKQLFPRSGRVVVLSFRLGQGENQPV